MHRKKKNSSAFFNLGIKCGGVVLVLARHLEGKNNRRFLDIRLELKLEYSLPVTSTTVSVSAKLPRLNPGTSYLNSNLTIK